MVYLKMEDEVPAEPAEEEKKEEEVVEPAGE